MRIIIGLHRLGGDRRGVSAVIVVVLSLVILVTIASNVILWSYQMNQTDWERMKEDLTLSDVQRVHRSPWFTVQNEYNLIVGGRLSGTYADTRTMNNVYERFVEAVSSFEYGYRFKSSVQHVQTASSTPVDDPEASLTVTLARDSFMLAVYNAGNLHGSPEGYFGKGCAISVDGSDLAFSWQSPSEPNYANSVTVVWAGWLSAGSHVIKGRFFSNNAGSNVSIDARQLIAFWFSDVTADYKRSTVKATTSSGSPVDDPEAVANLTLEEDAVALVLYAAANQRGSVETTRGKGVTLNIDGNDMATRQWQSPYAANHANSAVIASVARLEAGQHTVKGRIFSNREGYPVSVDERHLAVVCFPATAVEYRFTESAIPVSTSSGIPVNDTEAQLFLDLPSDSECVFMYLAGNPYGAVESAQGKGSMLSLDGWNLANSSCWQSPRDSGHANSVSSLWCGELSAGNYTVQGKFHSVNAGSMVTVSHRQILAIAFPKPAASVYRLSLTGTFRIDLASYPLAYVRSVEVQMRYRVNSTEERFYLSAYNWTASSFMDVGFNVTSGHEPSTEWSFYAVNLTDQWSSYVKGDGEVKIRVLDGSFDANQTVVDIDFLAVRVVLDATRFTFKNNGGSTLHVVALWVTNDTLHQRFAVDYFVNSGETISYLCFDIALPETMCVVKAVTERGNMAAYTVDEDSAVY